MQNEQYKIEHNIPFGVIEKSKSKYPFARMKIGDSFQFDYSDRVRVSVSLANFKLAHPEFDFKTKSSRDLGKGRVWRVAKDSE